MPGVRIALLACTARHEQTLVNAFASERVLHQTGRAGHRCADTAATAERELFSRIALIADALFPAADLIRAATRPIGLTLTRSTLTRSRIELPLATGVDALILTADFAQTTIDIDALPVNTGLAGVADVAATPAVVAIDLGIDALPVAHRPLLTALAPAIDTVLTRVANVPTGTTVTGISLQADTLLIAAGIAGEAAAGAALAFALFGGQSKHTGKLATNLFIALATVEVATGSIAGKPDLMCFGFALIPVAGCRFGDRWRHSPAHDGRDESSENPLEDLATRARGTERAGQIVEASFFHTAPISHRQPVGVAATREAEQNPRQTRRRVSAFIQIFAMTLHHRARR